VKDEGRITSYGVQRLAAHITKSVRWLGAFGNFPSPMNDSQYVHLIGLNIVDNAVSPFEDLSNLPVLEFGDGASGERECGNLLRPPSEAVNDPQSVGR
jgi:hypothetical protein